MEFEIRELDNGIRFIHQQTFNTNVSHLGLMINAGTRDEEADEDGLAHFIEHVIFKGTKKRKAHHILSRLDAVGGELNAYTTKEDTVIYASFLEEHLDRSSDLISDIFINSVFPEKELKKEKEVIVDEINSYLDSPSEQIFDDFETQVFKKHPIGNNILGTEKHLKTFDSKMVKAFIKKHYTTNRMVISSVGPQSTDKVFSVVEKYFGGISKTTSTRKKSVLRKGSKTDIIDNRDVFQVHKVIGSRAYKAAHKYKTGLTLLTNYIGGPALNSRLNMVVREKYGYTYNIEANYTPFSDTGIFSVYYGTDPKYSEKVDKLIRNEFKLLRDKKIGSKNLSMAKKQLLGQISLSQESKVNLMLAIGKSLLIYDQVDPLEVVYEKIKEVSEEDILEISNEVLSEDVLYSLSYIPKS